MMRCINPHLLCFMKQEIRSVELAVCPMQLFHLEQAQRDVDIHAILHEDCELFVRIRNVHPV